MSAGVSTQLKIMKRQSGPDSMDGKQINNLMGNRNNVADLQESSSQIQPKPLAVNSNIVRIKYGGVHYEGGPLM